MAGHRLDEGLPELLQIGDWSVRPREGVIERDGTIVAVRPRTMEVLVYLARRSGEVIGNDELIEQLWAPAVVGDDAVMVVISELRRALGDDSKHPTYIARIPKRGYQLIAAVGDGIHEPTPPSDLFSALEAVPPPFSAYDGDEPYVFVCYAHSDKVEVYPELIRLKETGINVWYDEGIPPSSEWTQELAHAIAGCDRFLYYVSPDSVASESCRAEVQFAAKRNIAMVAVHLEQTPLPEGLDLLIGGKQALLKYQIAGEDYRLKLLTALTGTAMQVVLEGEAVQIEAQDRRESTRVAPWVAVVALVAGATIGAVMMYSFTFPAEPPSSPTPIVRVPIQLDGWDDWKLANPAPSMVISADGKTVVFVARDSEGSSSLRVRHLDRPGTVELAGTEGAEQPFFSPDGHWVAYFHGHVMKRVSLDGGDP